MAEFTRGFEQTVASVLIEMSETDSNLARFDAEGGEDAMVMAIAVGSAGRQLRKFLDQLEQETRIESQVEMYLPELVED